MGNSNVRSGGMRSIKCLILGVAFTTLPMCMVFGQPVDSLSHLEVVEGKILQSQFFIQGISGPGTNYLRMSQHTSTYIPTIKQGIFCRWEDRIIQRSKVPIHFRLGSLSYADQLEGKGTMDHGR